MTAAQLELFDLAILKVAVANNARYGLTAAAITHLLPQFGFPNADSALVLDRIEYLIGKGMLEEVSKLLGKANRAFKATEAGRQYEDEH